MADLLSKSDPLSMLLRLCPVAAIFCFSTGPGWAAASGETETLVSLSGYRAVIEDPEESDPVPLVRVLTPDGSALEFPPGHEIQGELHWLEWIGHETWPYDALVQWTGGMGCCFWYTFVSKTPSFRALPRFDGGTASPELVDPGGDGVMEFVVREDTYSFGTDSVHRTMPEVIWRVTANGPELAKDLMAAWRHEESELDAIREELAQKSAYNDFLGWTLQMTRTIITQYYATDSLDAARAAFDRIWTPGKDGKEDWWARIVVQMRCGAFGIPGISCDKDDQ